MIVGSTIEDIEIPHEKGNSIGLRQLSGLEMDEASSIRSTRSMRRIGGVGAEALEALRAGPTKDITTVEEEIDPVTEYDAEYLVTHAIMRWSGPYYDMECNDTNKVKLDEPTLKWIVKEIVTRNHIPLEKSTISEISMIEG